MSLNFTAVNTSEHDNGAALGSLSHSNATVGSFKYYWSETSDNFYVENDTLYLGRNWHFDYEVNEYRKLGEGNSWSSYPVNDIAIKYTDTNGIEQWFEVPKEALSFSNIDESLSLESIQAASFSFGSEIAEVNAGDLQFASLSTSYWDAVSADGDILKLASEWYYNPNTDAITNASGTFYTLDEPRTVYLTLFDENNIRSLSSELNLDAMAFSNVVKSNTPYYAGSRVGDISQANETYINALLFNDQKAWLTDPVNVEEQTDAEETIITFSFSGINQAGQYTSNYTLPNPSSDGIYPFQSVHMEATRLALAEFEKVANIKFLEVEENADQVGTLRFAFTDAVNLIDPNDPDSQAGGWASGPYGSAGGGDIWINSDSMADSENWERGSSGNFQTLLHEIGHALGLNHPFDEPVLMPVNLDVTNYTLMSYTHPSDKPDTADIQEGAWWYPYWADSGDYVLSSTPMVYDIAALQHLYGPADYNVGDTVYSYDPLVPFAEAIWDTGGVDTLNFAGFSTDLDIFLGGDRYSTIPFEIANPSDPTVTRKWTMEDNLGLAFGSEIENIIGGSGSDFIKGNALDNSLKGNAGGDLFFFSEGHDEVFGGEGNDELMIGGTYTDNYGGTHTSEFTGSDLQVAIGNDDEVYLRIGDHQTKAFGIEGFSIDGSTYNTDTESNDYIASNFSSFIVSDTTGDDTTGDDTTGDDTTGDDTTGESTDTTDQTEPAVVQAPTINLNDADGSVTPQEAVLWEGITGTADAGTSVSINGVSTADNWMYQTTSGSNGYWSVPKSFIDSYLDGDYTIKAVAVDDEQNASDVVSTTVTLDLDIIEETISDQFPGISDVNVVSQLPLGAALSNLGSAAIESSDDKDHYYFFVEEALDLTINFEQSQGDLDAALYSEFGGWLDSSASESNNEAFSIQSPGAYILSIYGYDGATADYSLTATIGSGLSEDEFDLESSNDTIDSATYLGVISASEYDSVTGLTIDEAGDDDYFEFELSGRSDLDINISFEHSEGDLDIELLDSNGSVIDSSMTTSNEERISAEGLEAGIYYFRVYGFDGALSSNYSISANLVVEDEVYADDLFEGDLGNGSAAESYSLGAATVGEIVSEASINSILDEDFYNFTISEEQNLGLEVLFSHSDGDLDIELLDSDGYWIDSAASGDNNEYISLAGLESGTYTLRVFGYDQATIDDYSVHFVQEEVLEDWSENYDNWWDWLEAEDSENIAVDAFEADENNADWYDDIYDYAYDLDNVWSLASGSDSVSGLTIHEAGDSDWFKFTYDPAYRLDIGITFDGDNSDLDLDLYDANGWIDGSYSTEGFEEITMADLSAGAYYLEIYNYNGGVSDAYDLSFTVRSAAATNDLYDDYEPNDSFETAFDMGEATGEGRISDLTLTTGDEDWYKAYFPNDGTPDQFITSVFDHQEGDIDIEIYDANNTLLRSSNSVTDDETIYLSDIAGDEYYYVRVFSYYGDTDFQQYSIDYSFPVEVSEATITADAFEGDSGNEVYGAASRVDLASTATDLTIHASGDTDWFTFDTRNLSSSSSEISVTYDEALGAMNLSLWAIDVGASDITLVTASGSGTGREVISFDNYVAGTYYLQAFGVDGSLIPDYSLSMNVVEVEASQAASSVISTDQFDVGGGNNSSTTATNLGILGSTLNIHDLSIHSEIDKDYLNFQTSIAGDTRIDLVFPHNAGDIDVTLRNSTGTAIESGVSADDNETITFQSNSSETYTLEIYGYAGETNRDYDLTITPQQLNSRRDDYENNDTATQAVVVRDARASFNDLTLHNASDNDWFKFAITETAGGSNKVQVSNLQGANANLSVYNSDGSTLVESKSITEGSGSIDTSSYAAGNYYAAIGSMASSSATESAQLTNYDLYIDQIDGAASTENATWTVMVYIDGDNNLASAAVDDLNEMEGVVLPENVNVVTLTDLSGDYETSAGWTDTRRGEITPDPNGYSWYGDAATLVSDLESLGELNTGDPATLTNFIDWSTENHAADNYALVIWDHGGGLSGIAWDDTDNHDHLDLSEIKSSIDNSEAFSASNKLDLVGFDACLMQTYEIGLELAPIANVMVASQELEPGDGWDYQGFLQRLADNPYASAQTLGGYIVDSYDEWYDSSAETLSSVDLSKYQSIENAIGVFNTAAQAASGSDWLILDDAAESAWSSARHNYGWMGEERDLGQFFEYISESNANSTLKTAAGSVVTAIDDAVINNSSRQDLSGIQGGLLSSDAYLWTGEGLIGKNFSTWGQFQALYETANRTVRSASEENLSPDYSETRDALGRSSQGNNTSLTAFEIGIVSNATLIDNLTIHNAQDVDWYSFSTPLGLDNSGNVLKVKGTNSVPLNVALYDANRELVAQREGVESSFEVTQASNYYIKVTTSTGRQDISYSLDVDLVASDQTETIVVADIAEGSSSNDVLDKATELSFDMESDERLANLSLSLTEGDQDWFEISAGRLSEQSPNMFSVKVDDETLNAEDDLIIELADSDGTLLASSIAIGSNETVIFEDYTSDILFNVRSNSGRLLDYNLELDHADYDVDDNGSIEAETDGAAILASLFADSNANEVASNILAETNAANSLEDFVSAYRNNLLDVDGDGVTKASTDGVILDAYISGASPNVLLPLISANSPITTEDELLTHLLEIV